MRVKNVIKAIVALCLAVMLLVPMFGCNGGDGEEQFGLPKQYKNQIYYFQQGYKEGWDLIGDPDYKYSIADEVLVIELKPQADADSVRYCVHKMGETQWVPLTSTLEKVTNLVIDSESELFFNKIAGVRENFAFTTTEYTYEIVNGNQYSVIPYTFTKDGKDWQGELHILTNSREFFMITFEATKDKYTTYQTEFDDLLGDFRKIGYESASNIS